MRCTLSIIVFLVGVSLYSQREIASGNMRDTVVLGEIQVTAARYPQSLRSLAAPLQIVTASQLQRIPTGDLSAALASVPGVQLQSGTFQTLKLTLRGIGSRSQYGTNRTRVYIDDIPLTGGDGTSVFDDVELSFLSRAEITKGSYSAWYGSGMGGSLRFVSRNASHKLFSADAGVTAGSFGLLKLSGIAFTDFKTAKLTAGISRLTGDGYRQNSAFSRSSGLVSGEISSIDVIGKLSYLLMLSDVNAFTPSSVDESTYLNNPSAAAPNWLNVKGYKTYQRILAGLKLDTELNDSWSNILLVTTNTYDQYELRPFNILDDRSVTWSMQETLHYTSDDINVAVGVEGLIERYSWQTQANATLNLLKDAQETRRHLNAFASTEWHPVENLSISLAANLNLTEYLLKENPLPGQSFTSNGHYGKAIVSPMAGVVYHLNRSVSFYGSAGHGFSNPTVEESLSSDGTMNTLLQPEQGWTFDAGVKSWFVDSRLAFQTSVYTIFLNDLLVTKRPAEDVFFGENGGSSVLKGVEVSLDHQPANWLNYRISASVSNNRFKNFTDEGISFAGNYLPGIPHSQLFSSVDLTLPLQLKLNMALRIGGEQFADDANTVKVQGWKTVDAGLSYETTFGRTLHLRAQLALTNVFNEHYASMVLINAPSFGGRAPRYYYPAMPRNFAFNVGLRWE